MMGDRIVASRAPVGSIGQEVLGGAGCFGISSHSSLSSILPDTPMNRRAPARRSPFGAGCLCLCAALWGSAGTAAAQPPQPENQGIVFSEFHHVSTPGVGSLPTYIELLNLSITRAETVSGGIISVQRPGQSPVQITIPPGVVIPPGGTLVLSGGVITNPSGTGQILNATALFADPQILAQGASVRLCLQIPTVPPSFDQVDLNVTMAQLAQLQSCNQATWRGPSLNNPFARVNRVLYVDSDTFYDWDPGAVGSPPSVPTPAGVNVDLDHVNGFLFRNPATGQGIPIPGMTNPINAPMSGLPPQIISGAQPTTGSITIAAGRCRGVSVPNHPRFPNGIFDPLFDPVIFDSTMLVGGTVAIQGAVLGQDPFFGQMTIPALTWNLTVPPSSLTGPTPGVLNIDMAVMTGGPGGQEFFPNSTVGNLGRPRFSKIMTDNNPNDSGASGTGDLSVSQIDVLPNSTGGGDIWCEVIAYNEAGYSIIAKVRNWPANPNSCSTPNLGMGSNAVGNLDLIALCFPANSEIFILPTLNVATPTGSGALLGINPDPVTLGFLAAPLGVDPAHVTTTADGLYFYGLTDPGLSGLSLDAIAIEYQTGTGFVLPATPANTITVL